MGFAQRVETMVKKIPKGRVATYGQLAALCGSPRSARQVGWILFRSVNTLPWQRVINREGQLSIVNPEVTATQQAALLRRDGVEVTERSGSYWVDLKRYLWNPDKPGNRSRQRATEHAGLPAEALPARRSFDKGGTQAGVV